MTKEQNQDEQKVGLSDLITLLASGEFAGIILVGMKPDGQISMNMMNANASMLFATAAHCAARGNELHMNDMTEINARLEAIKARGKTATPNPTLPKSKKVAARSPGRKIRR